MNFGIGASDLIVAVLAYIVPLVIFAYVIYRVVKAGVRDGILEADERRRNNAATNPGDNGPSPAA